MGAVQQDLQGFYRFLGDRLAAGAGTVALEDLLDEWRAQHPSPAELQENVSAVREAIADMEAGDRGRPVDEVMAELNERLARGRRT